MKKKAGLTVMAVMCIAIIVGGYYYYTVQKREAAGNMGNLTEVQKVITKNLDMDYPKTPREVIRMYNRILACFYNQTCTDEEIEGLGDQARILFDKELLDNNPREDYLRALKADIEEYHDKSRVISSMDVCSASEVKEQTVDGAECAYVEATYYIIEGKAPSQSHQTYVLRKDEEGKWKILVFYQSEGASSNE